MDATHKIVKVSINNGCADVTCNGVSVLRLYTTEAADKFGIPVKTPDTFVDVEGVALTLTVNELSLTEVQRVLGIWGDATQTVYQVGEFNNSPRGVQLGYINWKGEFEVRHVIPSGQAVFEANRWHPEVQWLLPCFDIDKGANRHFALKDIRAWIPYKA